MKVRVWGTRGSLPTPGPATSRYGGNTSCLELTAEEGSAVVLDAGTGIRSLGDALSPSVQRIDVLLSHLHMDHILGLGFFAPLFHPHREVHLWGPPSTTLDLRSRLGRYLSPPLFPVRLRDLPCRLFLHDVPHGRFSVPGLEVEAGLVVHPGPTVGYRLTDGSAVVTYLPDHEPALGVRRFPEAASWTSGHDLASGADLLIHDSQYTDAEYGSRVGWGHSTIHQAATFAAHVGARCLLAFHHDPTHDDSVLDRLYAEVDGYDVEVRAAREGDEHVVASPPP